MISKVATKVGGRMRLNASHDVDIVIIDKDKLWDIIDSLAILKNSIKS